MTAAAVAGRPAWPGRALAAVALAAGKMTGRVLGLAPSVPGVSGAALVTAGAAMVVHAVFRQVPELGVAAAVAGMFLLLLDRRL